MPTEIKLPSLGEGVESGDVLEILVTAGDVVTKDQGLLELETDKATVTVPSPVSGKIVNVQVKEGQTVPVGSVIATIESSESASTAPPAQQPPQAKAEAPQPTPASTSDKSPNKSPAKDPPVSKANSVQSPAPTAPQSSPAKPAPPAPTHASSPQPDSSHEELDDQVIPAGPAIRRFAREVGVDLSVVTGSGENGRITRDDVLAVVRNASQAARVVANPATPTSHSASSSTQSKTVENKPGVAANDDHGPIRVERMAKIRKTIASQMHKSWSTVPRVVNFDDADVTELEAFRQSSKDDYASRGVKLTTMPFLIKAVATALRHHPALNAAIDMENEQIIYKDYINIGIAIDTERGLVVPTLKSADKMSIPDIAQGLGDLSARVRNNDFAVADLRGGTFTISNLGAIGGTYSTPIVNVPEVAILLVGRSRKLPVVMDDDSIKARLMMPLSLAYDHRLVDGGTAARFLNDIIAYLEAPSRLLLAI